MDILIRSYFSTRLYLLAPLWRSIDLFWPKGIGEVVLVLDEGDAALGAELLVPPWVAVRYEKNYLDLPGKILQQWSYGWADNYTSAPFIAIMDDDVVLNLKVCPRTSTCTSHVYLNLYLTRVPHDLISCHFRRTFKLTLIALLPDTTAIDSYLTMKVLLVLSIFSWL